MSKYFHFYSENKPAGLKDALVLTLFPSAPFLIFYARSPIEWGRGLKNEKAN